MRKTILLLSTLLIITLLSGQTKTIQLAQNKTVHLMFTSNVKYIDLGSDKLLSSPAAGVLNVIRLKASMPFASETNLSVICDDGSFYTFKAVYSEDPNQLFFEIPTHEANNLNEIKFKDCSGESANLISLIMKSIFNEKKYNSSHISGKNQKIKGVVANLYIHNKILYLRLIVNNNSNVNYPVDLIRFVLKDNKSLLRKATQEEIIEPLRQISLPQNIAGMTTATAVYAFQAFTIPNGKYLEVTIYDKEASRNIEIEIADKDILNAAKLNNINLY